MIVLQHLLFSMGERGILNYSKQRRFPLQRSIYTTSDIGLITLDFPLILSLLDWISKKTLFTYNTKLRNEDPRIDTCFTV